MIRHLVFLNFDNDVTQHTKDALMRDLEALRVEVDGFLDFQIRSNVSPETPLVHGLTEMFWIDFRDAQARDSYLGNETHKAVGARIMNSLNGGASGIFVCDIEI